MPKELLFSEKLLTECTAERRFQEISCEVSRGSIQNTGIFRKFGDSAPTLIMAEKFNSVTLPRPHERRSWTAKISNGYSVIFPDEPPALLVHSVMYKNVETQIFFSLREQFRNGELALGDKAILDDLGKIAFAKDECDLLFVDTYGAPLAELFALAALAFTKME